MQQQVGRRTAAPPAPSFGAKTQKRRYLMRRLGERVSDVFVVGGATAVGYLCVLHSEICANSRKVKSPLTLALSQRERGLIGGYSRSTPTCDFCRESIIDSVFQVDV